MRGVSGVDCGGPRARGVSSRFCGRGLVAAPLEEGAQVTPRKVTGAPWETASDFIWLHWILRLRPHAWRGVQEGTQNTLSSGDPGGVLGGSGAKPQGQRWCLSPHLPSSCAGRNP